MGESAVDQDAILDRYNAAGNEINRIARAAGKLGILGPKPEDDQIRASLTEDQAASYREFVDARLDIPSPEALEEQRTNAAYDLAETEAARRTLLGPMTSPSPEDGMLAGMIRNITGQSPSGQVIAAEVMYRLGALRERAITLQAALHRLGSAAVHMAEGGVYVSLLSAERREAIEAEVRQARLEANRQPTYRPLEEVSLVRPEIGAEVLIASGPYPMTIGELAEAVYGRLNVSSRSGASKMAAEAADGRGELYLELRKRGFRLERVEIDNPGAGEGVKARKKLIAYITLPLTADD